MCGQNVQERKKTIQLLMLGEIGSCAAYYYKCRSFIYTPPNFEEIYTANERAMLLAHENQHIKQRDPLLFLFLQGIQCVFWFNPFIYKAVQHIRHDRELLCDERVTCDYSKLEYGKLLLNEAQKALPVYMIAGIASQPSRVYERIVACTRPFSKNKRAAVAVSCIAVFLFAIGAVGFARPIVYHPMETMIVHSDDISFTPIEGFERFIISQPNGIVINQGLYQYAVSEGFETDDVLSLIVVQVRRPALFSSSVITRGFMFTVSDLKADEIFIPGYDAGFSLRSLWGVLYRVL